MPFYAKFLVTRFRFVFLDFVAYFLRNTFKCVYVAYFLCDANDFPLIFQNNILQTLYVFKHINEILLIYWIFFIFIAIIISILIFWITNEPNTSKRNHC